MGYRKWGEDDQGFLFNVITSSKLDSLHSPSSTSFDMAALKVEWKLLEVHPKSQYSDSFLLAKYLVPQLHTYVTVTMLEVVRELVWKHIGMGRQARFVQLPNDN